MGFSQYGYRSVSESSIDNEVPLYLSGQNKQAVSRIAPGAADGGLDVFADEVIQEHSGRKIFRAGYGPASSPTWVFSVGESATTITNYSPSGPAIFDVRAYGAVGEHTDDTAAIEAAADAINADTSFPGGVLFFPAGYYGITRPFSKFQHKFGVTIAGVNKGASFIMPMFRADHWEGLNLVDLSGAVNILVENICIGWGDMGPYARPDCGIYIDPTPTANSNALDFHRMKVAGSYFIGCLVLYCVASVQINTCDFLNLRYTGGLLPVNDTVKTACLVFTRDNLVGAVPAAGTASLPTDLPGRSNSDIHCTDLEVANWVNNATDGVSANNTTCVWIDGGRNISFNDGNFSSTGKTYVKLVANAASNGGRGVDNIRFSGVTMYTDPYIAGAPGAIWAISLENTAGLPDPVMKAENLIIDGGCFIGLQPNSSVSIVHAPAGSTFYELTILNWFDASGGQHSGTFNGLVVEIEGTGGTLTRPHLECNGARLSAGTAGVINDATHIYGARSTVTAATVSTGQFPIVLGGPVTLAANGVAYLGAGASATKDAVAFKVPYTMRLYGLFVQTATAPGTSGGTQSMSATVEKAPVSLGTYSDTTLRVVIQGTAKSGVDVDFSHQVVCNQGDWIVIRLNSSAGAATTAGATATLMGMYAE